jgi:hypothetical protein
MSRKKEHVTSNGDILRIPEKYRKYRYQTISQQQKPHLSIGEMGS